MTPSRVDEERMRRLERLAVLAFVQVHGLHQPALAATGFGSVQGLRNACAQDVARIVLEHEQPATERRAS